MNRSFIDDNGNPCSDGEEEQHFQVNDADKLVDSMYLPGGERSGCGSKDVDDIPKYFINAAELSEEDTFSTQVVVNNRGEGGGGGIGENNSSKVSHRPRPPRSRVPVSKSYPDIIQTTFNSQKEEEEIKKFTPSQQQQQQQIPPIMTMTMTKDNSNLESLVADSLENLTLQPKEGGGEEPVNKKTAQERYDEKPIKPFDKKTSLPGGIMNSSAFMTESQIGGGIFAEKPPEAWVIDLNSLSIDSEMELSRRRRGSGSNSNSNSLSFFVNMDSKGDADAGGGDGMTSSIGPDKKIFSMFVDMKEGEGTSSKKSQIPNLKKSSNVVNKPVLNVMETSTGSLKSLNNKKFPSPIFQHKQAAELQRQAARSEWEKQREKYFDSLDPNAMSMMMSMSMMGQPTNSSSSSAVTTIDDKETLGESTISNRSSLHVANVLESSFSSSIISSMETSQPEEMEICQGGACFKLQLDLTRMFQEGINTDVNINVSGKWIRAHKCILASRSQYFAAILSGHWVEKAGNTINLDGFSYSVVQFALYHIYSGTNEIPDTIDLLELATLTDLLGLEGLRENISQTFRMKFCHNFHRPCTGCITGVLECFPIAVNYGMDELHRKMIKWISKHFVRIWPTKGFASLGDDLIDKCLKYSINHLSVDNILDHTLGCDQLTTTMPSLRWTETIFNIVHQLSEECIQFVGENLSDVLQSQKFLQFGKGQAWNISRIEATFMQSMTLLKPDSACLSHTALTRLIELGTETIDEVEWSTSFVDFLKMLRDEVEKYLYANASKAVLSKCWEELGASFRKKICSSSFVGYDKFGNKIVKNNTTTTTANNVPSSSSNKTQKSSTSRSVGGSNKQSASSSSRTSSGHQHGHGHSSSVKVASVRPMQSHQYNNDDQQQHQNDHPMNKRTLSNLGGRSGSTANAESSSSRPNSVTTTTASRNIQRTTEIRPNSSSSRRTSTASPTHSANRTPNKPLTPCGGIPSKTSPLLGGGEPLKIRPTPGSATARNHALARQQSRPPPEPPKKSFLTNSAKAAAVSKPILKPPGQQQKKPTTSSSNSSIGGCGSHSPIMSRQTSKPGSGGSRYLTSNQGQGQAGSFSARSSFSNIERPSTTTTSTRKSKELSNNQTSSSKRNTTTTSSNSSSGRTVISNPKNQLSTTNKRPSSSSNAVKSTTKTRMTPVGRGQTRTTATEDFQSFSESFQPDSLMSRSSIETESGDVKMRTLAEIGRSSTFSKDEPTILGKAMDGSGYGQISGDYEDESFDDDEDYE